MTFRLRHATLSIECERQLRLPHEEWVGMGLSRVRKSECSKTSLECR